VNWKCWAVCICCALAFLSGKAEQENRSSGLPNGLLTEVAPGEFALGNLKLDKKRRTVTLPVAVNRVQGPMEYLLVTSNGKVHESILRTDAKPEQLHLAMLLLGATDQGTNETPTLIEGPVSNPSKEVIAGDLVEISLAWTENGKPIRCGAEELIRNEETHSSPKAGNWVYNGSVIWRGKFIAQLEGSIASLITDKTALMNYTGPGHDNDRVWTVNTNRLPNGLITMEMSIRLLQVTRSDK
jgi:hypothetical protein